RHGGRLPHLRRGTGGVSDGLLPEHGARHQRLHRAGPLRGGAPLLAGRSALPAGVSHGVRQEPGGPHRASGRRLRLLPLHPAGGEQAPLLRGGRRGALGAGRRDARSGGQVRGRPAGVPRCVPARRGAAGAAGMTLPPLRLRKGEERRLRAGHLWVFSNEVDVERTPLTAFEPGTMAEVQDARGAPLGSAYVNPRSLICARLVSRDPRRRLDRDLLRARVGRALALRELLFEGRPFYRLAFGEGDGLPGLVVDRYGDALVVQITTA